MGRNRKTLRIRSVKHLSLTLDLSKERLINLSDNPVKYYRTFMMKVKNKERDLLEAVGQLKIIQKKILDNILRRLPVQECSYGGAKGRSIKDNAKVHAKSKYIAKLDIRNFYPSIHSSKVYRFFINQECSPDVARILTSLTTYKYSLPLGTSTSPMLADQIVRSIDQRIEGIAKKSNMQYTRYVDDITLSGTFPLDRMAKTVINILKQTGFKVKKDKLIFYRPIELGDEKIICGVRVSDGQISAPLDYKLALEHELRQAIYQSRRQKVEGDFQNREHYRGRIGFAKWLNKKEGEKLERLYRRVKWRHLEWSIGLRS